MTDERSIDREESGVERFIDGEPLDLWRYLRTDLVRREEFEELRRRVERIERQLGLGR